MLGQATTRAELIADTKAMIQRGISEGAKYGVVESFPNRAGLTGSEIQTSGIGRMLTDYKNKLASDLEAIHKGGASIQEVEALSREAGFPTGAFSKIVARKEALKSNFPRWALYGGIAFVAYFLIFRRRRSA